MPKKKLLIVILCCLVGMLAFSSIVLAGPDIAFLESVNAQNLEREYSFFYSSFLFISYIVVLFIFYSAFTFKKTNDHASDTEKEDEVLTTSKKIGPSTSKDDLPITLDTPLIEIWRRYVPTKIGKYVTWFLIIITPLVLVLTTSTLVSFTSTFFTEYTEEEPVFDYDPGLIVPSKTNYTSPTPIEPLKKTYNYSSQVEQFNDTACKQPTKYYTAPKKTNLSGKIVYRCNGDICSINPDGSNKLQLTNTPLDEFTPRWSPDGSRIVFQKRNDAGWLDLWLMNADGSQNCLIYEGDDVFMMGVAWHPTLNRIYFSPGQSSGSGGQPHNLEWVEAACKIQQGTPVTGGPTTNYLEIDIAPDGSQLAASWYTGHSASNGQEICLFDFDEIGNLIGEKECLTSNLSPDSSPRFGASSSQLIWLTRGGNLSNLFKLDMQSVTNLPQAITDCSLQNNHYEVSELDQTGKYVVTAHQDQNKLRKLWLIDLDKNNMYLVTTGSSHDAEPDWYFE